jgi:chromate transporter
MNLVVLYFLLLKATLLSFSGLASLPMVHRDFVVDRKALTDRDFNAAVVAGRAVPGPNGLYIVGVGYFAAGVPGAVVAWLAMTTPAFLIIPLLRYLGRRADHPVVRGAIEGAIFAAAGLILAATAALARDAVTTPALALIALASAAFVILTRWDTLWVFAFSGLAGWLASRMGMGV